LLRNLHQPTAIKSYARSTWWIPVVTAAGEWAIDAAPMATPDGWTVEVGCWASPDRQGVAREPERTIVLWPESNRSPHEAVFTLVHEYAHALDHDVLDDDGRQQWMDARGHDTWPGDHGDSGREDLAEAVAWCITRWDDVVHDWLGDLPTEAECALAERLLERLDLG
jgi:hypothetical protein